MDDTAEEKKKPKKTSPTVRTLNRLRADGAHLVAVVEKWKPVTNYGGIYEASTTGKIRSVDRVDCAGAKRRGKELSQCHDSDGYHVVGLSKDGITTQYKVHRLIAITFNGAPKEGQEVNHKDGKKSNNTYRNLEWVTSLENHQHAAKTGLKARGESSGRSVLTERIVIEIRKLHDQGMTASVIANRTGAGKSAVEHVIYRRVWRHVA